MKIHIIGGSGSGKTTLAYKIAKENNIPMLDLDDIFWKNNTYGLKEDEAIRDKALKDFMQNDNYVIEGIYYKWLDEALENADKIYLMNVNIHIRNYRIIKRFIYRKLGLLKGKNDSFIGLIGLIKWNFKYLKVDMPCIIDKLKKYAHKVEIIK